MTYDQFLQEACPALDLVWRKYRRRAARHRVEQRFGELGLHSFAEYLELLRSDPEEAALLPDRMRITVTRFFRDLKAWTELKERVLPDLVAESSGTKTLRAWSAGCCGGEEPYSLAILWLQYLQPLHPDYTMEIIATDIDDASLDRASRASYRMEELREVPPELKTRWFTRSKGEWQVNGEAKAMLRLEKSNLLTDEPPSDIDLILCRYLPFTYYRGARLQSALRKLWESLRERGILMVGAKEDFPEAGEELFEKVEESCVFYRRREGPSANRG